MANSDSFAESDGAEEVDEVASDRGAVIRAHASKDGYDVAVGCSGDVNAAKQDDDVAIHLAFNIDAAKDADCVAHGGVGRYFDVGADVDGVSVGSRGNGCNRTDGSDQTAGK